MSFPFRCTICPMKFKTEEDLQIHGQVHAESSYVSNYDFDSNAEPLFNDFLTTFFPRLNEFYIPALNDFSVPDDTDTLSAEWDDPSSISSSEDDVTYTALTNVNIPSENLESESSREIDQQRSIKSSEKLQQSLPQPDRSLHLSNVITKKLTSTVRFVNPSNIHTAHVFHQGPFTTNVLKPVYITRRPSSLAMVQHRYEEDRLSGYPKCYTSILRPALLTNVATLNIKIKSLVNKSVSEQREITDGATFDGFDVDDEDPNKPLVIKKALKRSRKSTIGVKPYSCEVCGKRFAFFKKFIGHKRIHVVGKLFSCYLCHRRFGYSYKLNQHMRLHAAQSLERCDLCKRTFKNSGHLRRHRCKGVSKKIMHRKKSSEISSYICTVCHRTFGRINYLNLHMRCHEDRQNPRNVIQERFLPIESLDDSLE